LGQPDLCF